jgi:hypothetical protein
VVATAGKIPGLKGRWLAHADDDPDADALARQRRALYGAAKREGKPMAQITPVEIDGKHYVDVNLGAAPKRYGPYADASEAGMMARKFAAVYSVFKGGLADPPAGAPAVKKRA